MLISMECSLSHCQVRQFDLYLLGVVFLDTLVCMDSWNIYQPSTEESKS